MSDKTHTVTFMAPKNMDNKHVVKKVFGRTVVDYRPISPEAYDGKSNKLNFMDEPAIFGDYKTKK